MAVWPTGDGQLEVWAQVAERYRSALEGVRTEAWRTPTNRASQADHVERAYLERRRYEPRFDYEEVPGGAEEDLRVLADTCPDDPWSQQVAMTCRYLVATTDALRRRSAAELTEVSTGWFGPVDPDVVAAARVTLDGPTPDGVPTVGADELVAALREALGAAGLADWQVDDEPAMAARVAVAAGARRIKVRCGARFTTGEVRRLVVHEVGCHVFRHENGSAQPAALLGLRVGPYLATEEGLAVWLEHHHQVATEADDRRYALRAVAVDAALAGTFSDTYATLRRWAGPRESYETCLRVRRGIADQHEHGAYVKDKVYLEGYTQVGRHLAEHPEDLSLLMAGKVSLAMLDEVRELDRHGLLVPARYVPGLVAPRPTGP